MEGQVRHRKILGHEVTLIGFLLVITTIRFLTKVWTPVIEVLWWWLGAVLGFVFVFSDRFIYAFVQNPTSSLSLRIKELFSTGSLFKAIGEALRERGGDEHLVIRSALFLLVYLVMAFFTMTSVGDYFGRGFMLGLGLHLLFDFASDYWGRGRDVRLWFWQIKREMGINEIIGVFWAYVFLFLLIGVNL